MKSTKLERLNNEIEKAQAKFVELQEKLKELEAQKIELENDEIINFVRDDRVSEAELNDFILSLRRKTAANAENKPTQRNRQRTEESKNARTNEN